MTKSELTKNTPANFVIASIPESRVAPGAGNALERRVLDGLATATFSEETLIVDDRSGLSPAQMVETKLTRILKETSMPVSHLQMRGILRNR